MREDSTMEMPVTRYRTPAGDPTCAFDFEAGEVCQFLRTQRMGVHETCIFAPEHKGLGERIFRNGKEGRGYLVPGKWCPVFLAGTDSSTGDGNGTD